MPKRRMKRHAVSQPLDTSYRFIALTRNQNAIVDARDFEWLDQWNWFAVWNPYTRSFYAYRCVKTKNRGMHCVILGCKNGKQGDHKNHDTLDNRRDNLRKCTSAQNRCNMKVTRRSTTGYKGVFPYHTKGKWKSQISINDRSKYLGVFSSPEAAGRAYDEAAKKYYGEFAHLNFPA